MGKKVVQRCDIWLKGEYIGENGLHLSRNEKILDIFGPKSVIFGQKWYIPDNFGQEKKRKKENFFFADKEK